MRMRSIRDSAKLLKEMDPNTELTEATIRKMIAEGTIPAFKTGNKYLVNVDLLLEMFGGSESNSIKVLNKPIDYAIEK